MPARRPAPLYRRIGRNVGLRVSTTIANATSIDNKAAEEERGRKRQRTSDSFTDRFGEREARTETSPELKRKRVLLRGHSRSPFKRPAPPSPISPVTPDDSEDDSFDGVDPERILEGVEGEDLGFAEEKDEDEDSVDENEDEEADRTDGEDPVAEELEDKDELELDSLTDPEDPDRTLVAEDPIDLKDYHEIVPGVFLVVGLLNLEDLPKSLDEEFTHVVRVAPGKADFEETWNVVDEESGVEVLNLLPVIIKSTKTVEDCGSTAVAEESRSGVLNLTTEQLRVARDFLSIALPYYSETNPPSPSLPKAKVAVESPKPKALIIAPTHIDALSIAVTYLAFCSGEHAFEVIRYIDEEPEVPDAWRGVFSVVESEEEQEGEEEEECEGMWCGESAMMVEIAARLEFV